MPGRNHALKMREVKLAAVMYVHARMSRRQVAMHFKVSDMAVRNALKLLGVPMRPRVEALRIRTVVNSYGPTPVPTTASTLSRNADVAGSDGGASIYGPPKRTQPIQRQHCA